MLPVALIAMMVVACGPSQEEIAAQEQVIADSVAAHEAQVILDAEAAHAELDAAAQAEVATTDSSVTATDASTK